MATDPCRRYTALLDRIHAELLPATYLEIGVDQGRSLSLALPGTAVIGIDPAAAIRFPVDPSAQVFSETSDDFFRGRDVRALLGGRAVDLAFIDGMHLFEYALRDFIALERHCERGSTILLHDCYPIDEASSARERPQQRGSWSGDVWKVILCLKEHRPDLRVVTVDVAPTGMGIVTNLDPSSTVLQDRYDEICEKYIEMGYEALTSAEGGKAAALSRVADDWNLVRPLLPPRPRPTNLPRLIRARALRWRPGLRVTLHRDARLRFVTSRAAPVVRAVRVRREGVPAR